MSIEAPRGCSTTSLTSLFPRQVMLGISNNTAAGEKVKEKKKDKKKDFKENTEHRVTDAKQNGGPLMTAGRSALLRSIAAFLKSNDFARTLEVFISETQLELDDIESCELNLEDILSKFMESRSPDESPINQEDPRDYTAIAEEANKYETTSVAVVSRVDQTPKKSKKKKRKEQEVSSEVALDNLEQKTRCLEPVEKFDESHVLSNTTNKKSKSTAATSNEKEVGADKLRDFVEEKLDELKSAIQDEPVGIKTKERKKKKNKSHEINGITAELEATQKKHDSESDAYTLGNGVADANNEQTLKNTESKSKEKKKRKSKPVSEDLAVEQKDSIYVQHNTHEVTEVKSKDSKKRKKSGSEPEGVSNGENGPENKKQKTEDSDAEKLAQKSGNCVKDNAGKANDSDNKHVLLADNVGDNSTSKKRPEQKGSAEPKTIKAFQRVKVDEVQFVDERLQDNSYWAKGGAEVGYGAKAQEVLGQVRGRDFRHEKTKKKRGSYRGGQIDLGTHSIKFNYSDDE